MLRQLQPWHNEFYLQENCYYSDTVADCPTGYPDYLCLEHKSFFLGILYDTNWILIIRSSHIQYLLAREAFKVEMINDKYHTFYEGWVGFEAIITLLILCL